LCRYQGLVTYLYFYGERGWFWIGGKGIRVRGKRNGIKDGFTYARVHLFSLVLFVHFIWTIIIPHII
jgi:hypothetical protein